ncbi:MAG: DegV family EDD domain-containing protein [Chloroflexi bacterium]|nr:DegV family EDD domain-containing protein [Chloroflexota bacterium]
MSDVRIVTDSTALFLNPRIVKEYNVTVVPAKVRWGDESYQLGVDIDNEDILHRIQTSLELPVLEAPSVEDFVNVYQRLSLHSEGIISIHSAARLSKAFANATQAQKTVLGRSKIDVIDTETICAGLGIIVAKAAQYAAADTTFEQVARDVRHIVPRIYSMFFVESMEVLALNKIMGQAQTIIGTMLDLKPFLAIEEGQMMVVEKAQTLVQAVEKLAEFAAEFEDVEQIAIISYTSELIEPIRLLQDRLALDLNQTTVPTVTYGAMTATLLGPDAIGMYILEAESEDDAFGA